MLAKTARPNKLIDTFGRAHTYLRISVTDRCNLRCVYCMPPEGIAWRPKNEILTFEEILRISKIFVSLGINKIRITGGEPMVRQNVEYLLRDLKAIEGVETLAMTTNAVLLKDKLSQLKNFGLDALNISLDTLRPQRFLEITKRENFAEVLAAINMAAEMDFQSVKVNVVVMVGVNDDEVMDFVEFVKDKNINIRFIEYMPFKDNQWNVAGVVNYATMKKQIEEKFALAPSQGHASDVAKDFQIVGHRGKVSFITSMSDSFCSTCNRLRLTTDGFIKSCLFYDGEINLRDAMRQGASDKELEDLISQAVLAKPEAHPPMEELAQMNNRTMIEIGG